jgi:hypothetical protein
MDEVCGDNLGRDRWDDSLGPAIQSSSYGDARYTGSSSSIIE